MLAFNDIVLCSDVYIEEIMDLGKLLIIQNTVQ